MSKIKKLIITAVCVALGVVVPMAFHTIPNAGIIFCPMHIPIFICSLICGWKYGLVCGVLCPVISSISTGMPAFSVLPFLIVEFIIYGITSGLIYQKINTKRLYADLYFSLILSMLLGRIANGIVKAIALTGAYSIGIWLSASFVKCIPGIIIQLILIPNIVMILIKAKLIPSKYNVK